MTENHVTYLLSIVFAAILIIGVTDNLVTFRTAHMEASYDCR
jgi:hypothetical protein